MNEKKQSGKKRLFLLVLVAFGIVLWITFTNLNRIALRHTLDETIGFVKIRLEQYETDAANDRVKSLVRLLDKTVSLGNEIAEGRFRHAGPGRFCRGTASDRCACIR